MRVRKLAWLAIVNLACAHHSLDSARTAIDATARSHAALITAFVAWDNQHQQQIVADGRAAGKTQEQRAADLAAYRAARAPAIKISSEIDAALETGALVIALVEAGQTPQQDTTTYLLNLIGLVKQLYDALRSLGFSTLLPTAQGGGP